MFPELDVCTDEFCQTFKFELVLILHRLLQNIGNEVTLPNSFYEASINLILKLHEDF